MKKSLLAIALAVAATPFVFAAQATGTNSGTPAQTTAAKKPAKKHVRKARKAKKAPTTPASQQK